MTALVCNDAALHCQIFKLVCGFLRIAAEWSLCHHVTACDKFMNMPSGGTMYTPRSLLHLCTWAVFKYAHKPRHPAHMQWYQQ